MKSIQWAIGALLVAQSARGGEITYDLINIPADQQGWNLSGTITTDGKLGALTSSDIRSWTVTITDANKSHGFNSSGKWALAEAYNLSATSTALLLSTTPPGYSELVLGASLGGNTPADYVIWYPSSFSQDGQPQYDSPNYWTIHEPSDYSCDQPWTIATVPHAVPEPSSFVLICGAMTLVGSYSKFRNRG
jgi:hypothetical protein